MELLRTPDERFADLPAFDYAPRYVDDLPGYAGTRIHYVDEGVARHGVALCLHGNPTWSYLYRKMIPVFSAAGFRVVAPDLIGCGRSDKPLEDAVHSFDFHRDMLLRFVERLDLREVLLVVQDWGGLLGLTLPLDLPDRFTRLLLMNTALATGAAPSPGFVAWRDYSNRNPDLPAGKLLARSCPELSAAEAAAYDAPFPDIRYKAALRAFPNIVPDQRDAPGAALSRRALQWWRSAWQGQSFMAIGMQDPVLGEETMRALHAALPRCPAPLLVADGGHFLQERGEAVAHAALRSFGIPLPGNTAENGAPAG